MAARISRSPCHRSKCVFLLLISLACQQSGNLVCASAIRAEQHVSANGGDLKNQGPQTLFSLPDTSPLPSPPLSSPAVSKLDLQKAGSLTVASPAVLSEQTIEAGRVAQVTAVSSSVGDHTERVAPTRPSAEREDVSPLGEHDGAKYNNGSLLMQDDHLQKNRTSFSDKKTADDLASNANLRTDSEKRDLVNGQARKHSHVKSGVSLISKSDKNVGKKNEKFVSPFPDTLSSEIINDLHFKDPITNPAINHEANFSNAHARHLLNQTGDQLNIPSYSPNVFKPITSQEELRVGKDEEDSPRLKRDKIPESDAYISNKLLKHGNSDDQEPGTINISSTLQYKENYSLGVKDATRKQYVPRETTVYSKFTTPNPMDFKNSTDLENQLQQSYNISREIELVHSHQKSRMPAPKSSLLNRVMGKSNEEENNQTLFANENNDTFGKPVQSTGIPMDLPETTPRERSYKQGDLESTSEVDLSDQGFSAAQQGVPLSAPASLERPNRLEHNNSLAPDTDLDLNQSRVTDDLSDIKTTGVYVQASINDIHMKNTELENVNFERNHMRSTISDENGNQNIKQKSHKEEIYIMPSSHFQNEGFALLDVKVESSVTNGMRGPVSHSSPRSEIFPNGSGESRLGPPRVKHTNVEGVITVARDAGGTALLKGVNNVALRERVDGAAFHDSFDYSALPEGVDRTSLPESVVRIAFSEAVDDIALPGGFNDIAVPEAIDNITLPKGGWGVNIPGDTDGINLPEVVDSIALPERVDGLTFPESANSIPLLGNIGQPEQYLDTSQWSNWDSFKPQMDLMTDIRELQTLLEGMSEIAHNTGEELGGLSRTKASVPKETNSESTARIHRDPRIFSDDLPADRGADAFPTYLGDRSNISSETNQTLLPLPVHGLSLGKTVYDTDIETEHFINVGNVNMVASVSHQNIGTPESNDSPQQSEDTNFKRLQRESAMSNPDINNLVSNNSQLIVPKVQEIPDKQPKILLPVSRLYPVPMMYPVSDLPKNSYLSKSSSRPPPSPPKPVSSPRPDFNIKTPGANYILSQSQPLASRLHAVEQLTAGKQFDGRDSIIAKLDVIMKELVKKMNLTQDINTTIGENRNLTETPSTPVISTDKILGPYASIARRESGDIDMIEDDFYGSADPDLYQTDLSDDIERNTRLLKQLSKKLSQTPALNSESTSATRQSPLSADDRRYSLKDQNKLLLPNDVPEFKLKSLGSMSHQSKGNLVNESGREKHFKYFSGYDLRSTPSLGESLPNNSDISPEKQKSISTHVKSRDDNSDVESDQDRTDLAHIADSKDTTIATSHADATPNTDDQHGKVSTTGKERIEHLENEKGKLDLNVHGDVSEKALHRTDIRGYGGDATPISIYESNISNEKNIADKGVFGSDGTEQQLSPFYQNDLPPGFKPTFVDNKEYAQKGNVRTYSMSDMIPGGFSSHGDFGLHDEVNQHLESQEGSLELDRNSFSNKYAEWQELRSHNPGSDPEDALEVEHLIPREDPRSGSYLGKVQPFFNKDSHHQGYGQKMWSVSDAFQNKDSAAEAYFEPEEDVFHYQNDQIEDLYPSSIYDSSNLYKEYDPTTWDRGDSDISNFKSFYSGLQDTSSGMESFKFGEGDAFLFPDGNMDIAPDGYKPLSKKDINHVDHLEFSNANELPRLIKAEIWTDKQNVPSRPGIPLESLDGKYQRNQDASNSQYNSPQLSKISPIDLDNDQNFGDSAGERLRFNASNIFSLSQSDISDEITLPDEIDGTRNERLRDSPVPSMSTYNNTDINKRFLPGIGALNFHETNVSSTNVRSDNIKIKQVKIGEAKTLFNQNGTKYRTLAQDVKTETGTLSKDSSSPTKDPLSLLSTPPSLFNKTIPPLSTSLSPPSTPLPPLPMPPMAFQVKKTIPVQMSNLHLNISKFSSESLPWGRYRSTKTSYKSRSPLEAALLPKSPVVFNSPHSNSHLDNSRLANSSLESATKDSEGLTTFSKNQVLLDESERSSDSINSFQKRPEPIDIPEISPYKAQVLDFSLRQAAPTEGDPSSNKDPLVKDSGGEKFLFNILPTVATNTNTNISFANEAFGNISMSSSNNNMTELAPLLSPLAAFPTVRTRAAMSAVLTTHFGPTKDRMVPFDLELLDLGDNYDNTSGTFICTVPGTYVISLHLMAHPGAKVNARVHVNSRPIAALWADDNGGAGFYPSSSTHTLSHLDFGDQVYVMLVDAGYGESWVHANYNGFSVYLLYEDPLPF